MKNLLPQQFGNIDIYLFDQILKGRLDACRSVLDVGCGGGRNLVYFLQNGFEVFGLDPQREAVQRTRDLAQSLAPSLPASNFVEGSVESRPFGDRRFDSVLCNAVLHFARDEAHFRDMLDATWEALAPGGLLFVRLASDIGLEDRVESLGNRRFLLPDGSERFLVNEAMLQEATARLGGTLLDPLKTTIVQNLRCMTTWCLQRDRSG